MDPEEITRLRPRGYSNLEEFFQGEGGDPSFRLVFGLEVALPTVAMGNEPVRGRWEIIHTGVGLSWRETCVSVPE